MIYNLVIKDSSARRKSSLVTDTTIAESNDEYNDHSNKKKSSENLLKSPKLSISKVPNGQLSPKLSSKKFGEMSKFELVEDLSDSNAAVEEEK